MGRECWLFRSHQIQHVRRRDCAFLPFAVGFVASQQCQMPWPPFGAAQGRPLYHDLLPFWTTHGVAWSLSPFDVHGSSPWFSTRLRLMSLSSATIVCDLNRPVPRLPSLCLLASASCFAFFALPLFHSFGEVLGRSPCLIGEEMEWKRLGRTKSLRSVGFAFVLAPRAFVGKYLEAAAPMETERKRTGKREGKRRNCLGPTGDGHLFASMSCPFESKFSPTL